LEKMSSDDVIDLQPGEGEHVQGVGEQVHGAEEPVQDEGLGSFTREKLLSTLMKTQMK
jgi:hypothetical protein